jgi:DNA-directed RNA polymerase specialized sigma24 family protein
MYIPAMPKFGLLLSLLLFSFSRELQIRHSRDRSVKEVAELAGISVAATKSRLSRARRILRKTLS